MVRGSLVLKLDFHIILLREDFWAIWSVACVTKIAEIPLREESNSFISM